MNQTEEFAKFLVSEMQRDPVGSLDKSESYVDTHLIFYIASLCSDNPSLRSDSFFAERRRLAAAFDEQAPDTELKQAILDKILNRNPAI